MLVVRFNFTLPLLGLGLFISTTADADPIVVLGLDLLLVGQVRKIQVALSIETRVASVSNPESKIENPKSSVRPSAILTGSRTRPSDGGSNARFGPLETEDTRCTRVLAAGNLGDLQEGTDAMTKVAVYHESADPESMPFRAVSGRNQAMGRTAGEALDALGCASFLRKTPIPS